MLLGDGFDASGNVVVFDGGQMVANDAVIVGRSLVLESGARLALSGPSLLLTEASGYASAPATMAGLFANLGSEVNVSSSVSVAVDSGVGSATFAWNLDGGLDIAEGSTLHFSSAGAVHLGSNGLVAVSAGARLALEATAITLYHGAAIVFNGRDGEPADLALSLPSSRLHVPAGAAVGVSGSHGRVFVDGAQIEVYWSLGFGGGISVLAGNGSVISGDAGIGSGLAVGGDLEVSGGLSVAALGSFSVAGQTNLCDALSLAHLASATFAGLVSLSSTGADGPSLDLANTTLWFTDGLAFASNASLRDTSTFGTASMVSFSSGNVSIAVGVDVNLALSATLGAGAQLAVGANATVTFDLDGLPSNAAITLLGPVVLGTTSSTLRYDQWGLVGKQESVCGVCVVAKEGTTTMMK